MAIIAMAAALPDQFVCWVEASGQLKRERVLVWVVGEEASLAKAQIWCMGCDGAAQDGVMHAKRKHGAQRVWIGDEPF